MLTRKRSSIEIHNDYCFCFVPRAVVNNIYGDINSRERDDRASRAGHCSRTFNNAPQILLSWLSRLSRIYVATHGAERRAGVKLKTNEQFRLKFREHFKQLVMNSNSILGHVKRKNRKLKNDA